MSPPRHTTPADAAHRDAAVAREVGALLSRSAAFSALPEGQRAELARDMTRVGAYLADPSWLAAHTPARARALAESDPVRDLQGRLAQDPGQIGAEFQAGALRQGVEEFGNLVKKVDFPAFVAGLVHGVFNAVVDASIQQMKAYGEMLAAVSKSVDQFASDHISDYDAREFVASRYPSAVRLDASGEGPARLAAGDEDTGIEQLAKDFGVASVSLDDETSERALVNAAKLEMARSRQQLMATMVLLGINRIVVTNGQINAKVVFDVQASDEARRRAEARMKDEKASSRTRASAFGGSFGGLFGGGTASVSASSHTTSVSSAVDDTSESRAQMKATLSGDVKLSFRSETFPLERMVDAGGMDMLNKRAQPGATPAPAAPPGGAR